MAYSTVLFAVLGCSTEQAGNDGQGGDGGSGGEDFAGAGSGSTSGAGSAAQGAASSGGSAGSEGDPSGGSGASETAGGTGAAGLPGAGSGGGAGQDPMGGAGEAGTAGAGGTVDELGGAGGAGGSTPEPELGPDGFPVACLELLTLPENATQTLDVQLSIENGGLPLLYGEPNPLAIGGSVLPTNFRFYLSQVALTRAEELIPVTLVDAEDLPLPFGVQLVNAEDDASLSFRAAFPPGSYDGISFLLGISDACNSQLAGNPPLDAASQLTWPHTLGFLFLRFEGQVTDDGDAGVPNMIHMGAAAGEQGGAPRVAVRLPVEAQTTSIELTMVFDQVLNGAMAETDLSDFELLPPAPPQPDEEILAGERLRRSVNSLGLFRDQVLP